MTNSEALHVAVKKGRCAEAQELLAQGAPVDLPNAEGFSPLIVASMKNDIGAYTCVCVCVCLCMGCRPSRAGLG